MYEPLSKSLRNTHVTSGRLCCVYWSRNAITSMYCLCRHEIKNSGKVMFFTLVLEEEGTERTRVHGNGSHNGMDLIAKE